MKKYFFILLVSFLAMPLLADDQAPMSPERLLFLDVPVIVGIASSVQSSLNEAPGIVSVIQRRDIQNLGARNMDDYMMMVPGYVPAADVQNAESYGIRGIYGMEGKILEMVDGMAMDDIIFGNPVFGAQFLTDYLDRVEIIRGPGSALYGGTAELGVINFISRGAEMKGGYASVTYGQTLKDMANRIVSTGYGNTFDDIGFYLNLAAGDGMISDRNFMDSNTVSVPLDRFGNQQEWMASAGLDAAGLSLKYVGSYYGVLSNGIWSGGTYTPGPDQDPFLTTFNVQDLSAKYRLKVLDNLTITPELFYTNQETWANATNVARNSGEFFVYPAWLLKGGLSLIYDFTRDISLTAGGSFSHDETLSLSPSPLFSDGSDIRTFNLQSYFAEATAKLSFVNFTAGARYEEQEPYGGAFVPRFALTKEFGDFHFKAMANYAYRAPAVFNIDYNNDVKPEYTDDYEAELGYKLGNMALTVNCFDTVLKQMIVYFQEGTTFSFTNAGNVGTSGFEAEYKIADTWGSVKAAYSFYNETQDDSAFNQVYDPNGNTVSGVTAGLPTHKITAAGNFKITDTISINPWAFYLSKRYVVYSYDDAGDIAYKALDPVVVANIFVRIGFGDDLELGIGCYNLFDARYCLAPGFIDDQAEVPALSREYLAKLSCKF